ncbi:hypothetical protein [Thioalkalivibrio sp. HK1]|uniref:hypothetical protein n=1 Tax=Thioalkalivibrio sp. HK1 TaxID=1469245 RepID=UPI0012DDB06A|nr:hypothetical protein [Thioalkalivibrio sp. HK1]
MKSEKFIQTKNVHNINPDAKPNQNDIRLEEMSNSSILSFGGSSSLVSMYQINFTTNAATTIDRIKVLSCSFGVMVNVAAIAPRVPSTYFIMIDFP